MTDIEEVDTDIKRFSNRNLTENQTAPESLQGHKVSTEPETSVGKHRNFVTRIFNKLKNKFNIRESNSEKTTKISQKFSQSKIAKFFGSRFKKETAKNSKYPTITEDQLIDEVESGHTSHWAKNFKSKPYDISNWLSKVGLAINKLGTAGDALKDIGHVLGLRGQIVASDNFFKDNVSLEGNEPNRTHALIASSFKEYVHSGAEFPSVEQEIALTNEDKEALVRVLENSVAYTGDPSSAKEAVRDFQEGKIVTIGTGWRGHALEVTLFKDDDGTAYLAYTNRGQRSQGETLSDSEAKTTIYKIGKPEEITPSFITYLSYGNDGTRKAEHLEQRMHFLEGNQPHNGKLGMKAQLQLEKVGRFNKKDQKVGNCSFANAKAGLHAALFFMHYSKVKKIDPVKTMSIESTLTPTDHNSSIKLLAGKPTGTYLTRPSSIEGKFAISYVNTQGDIQKILLEKVEGGFKFAGSEYPQVYRNLAELETSHLWNLTSFLPPSNSALLNASNIEDTFTETTTAESQELLASTEKGTYLTRSSSNSPGFFALSVSAGHGRVEHYLLEKIEEGFREGKTIYKDLEDFQNRFTRIELKKFLPPPDQTFQRASRAAVQEFKQWEHFDRSLHLQQLLLAKPSDLLIDSKSYHQLLGGAFGKILDQRKFSRYTSLEFEKTTIKDQISENLKKIENFAENSDRPLTDFTSEISSDNEAIESLKEHIPGSFLVTQEALGSLNIFYKNSEGKQEKLFLIKLGGEGEYQVGSKKVTILSLSDLIKFEKQSEIELRYPYNTDFLQRRR